MNQPRDPHTVRLGPEAFAEAEAGAEAAGLSLDDYMARELRAKGLIDYEDGEPHLITVVPVDEV